MSSKLKSSSFGFNRNQVGKIAFFLPTLSFLPFRGSESAKLPVRSREVGDKRPEPRPLAPLAARSRGLPRGADLGSRPPFLVESHRQKNQLGAHKDRLSGICSSRVGLEMRQNQGQPQHQAARDSTGAASVDASPDKPQHSLIIIFPVQDSSDIK